MRRGYWDAGKEAKLLARALAEIGITLIRCLVDRHSDKGINFRFELLWKFSRILAIENTSIWLFHPQQMAMSHRTNKKSDENTASYVEDHQSE